MILDYFSKNRTPLRNDCEEGVGAAEPITESEESPRDVPLPGKLTKGDKRGCLVGDRAWQSHNPLTFQFSTQGPLLRATHRGPWSLPQTSSPPRPEIIFLLQWVPCLLRTTLSTPPPPPPPPPPPGLPLEIQREADRETETETETERGDEPRPVGKWCREGLSDAGLPQNFTHTRAHTDTHAQTHAHTHAHQHPPSGPAAQRPLSVKGLEATCRATRIPQCPRALAANRDPRAHPPRQPLGLPAALCGRDLSCGLRTPGPPRARGPPFLCPGNPSEAFGARQAGGGPAFVGSVLPDAERPPGSSPAAAAAAAAARSKAALGGRDRAGRVLPRLRSRAWGSGLSPSGRRSPAAGPAVKPGAEGHGTSFRGSAPRAAVDTGRVIPDGGGEGQLVGPAAHTAQPPWTRGPGRRPTLGEVLLRGGPKAGACLGLGGPVGVEGAGPCLPLQPPLGCPLASGPSRALGLPPGPWVGLRPGAPASSPGDCGNRALPGLSRPPVASSCLERLGFPGALLLAGLGRYSAGGCCDGMAREGDRPGRPAADRAASSRLRARSDPPSRPRPSPRFPPWHHRGGPGPGLCRSPPWAEYGRGLGRQGSRWSPSLQDTSAPAQGRKGRPGSRGAAEAKGQAGQAPGQGGAIPACGPEALSPHRSTLSRTTRGAPIPRQPTRWRSLPPPAGARDVSRPAPFERLSAAENSDFPSTHPQRPPPALSAAPAAAPRRRRRRRRRRRVPHRPVRASCPPRHARSPAGPAAHLCSPPTPHPHIPRGPTGP
ncbi:basic proline-rich protein-like [Phacochoerus africanus]|uniref:basic proline-rich protein-like n=1 Tax=Phacochoerus africanus TaxID=41426 RepID=UPI001FD9178F|nr:basic proline-rich protein-like [Phacochoerus africanus]